MTARAAAWCLLGAVLAQDPSAPKADPAAVERADALLAKLGQASRGIDVLVASYVQHRTTKLQKEPLESRGEFLFVKKPACVMFRARTPRESVVRLQATTYEVYRPQKKQLERFELDGPELAEGLFAAVAGDVERLRADFTVRDCRDVPNDAERAVVHLVPAKAAARERLQELLVTVSKKDGALASVAYRDAAGDLVEIELHDVRRNPPDAPPATLDVPEGTTVVEHAPPKKKG